MKSKYHTSSLRNASFGISLAAAITFCLSGSAFAADWNGSISTDWNTAENWTPGGVPANPVDAVINSTPANVATIAANISATPRDITVGTGAGSNGVLNHTAGVAFTGTGNWVRVGVAGIDAQGTYNLANPSESGGTFTNMGTGGGDLSVGGISGTSGRLYVGGDEGGGDGGIGTFNVNTTGTLTVRNDLVVGAEGGTGVFNMDFGTVTTGGWNFFGTAGGTGTFNISGGTFNNPLRQYVGNGNSKGVFNMTGGTFTNGTNFSVGSGNMAHAEPSTFALSGGTFTTGPFAVGGEALNDGASGKGTGTISGTAVANFNADLFVGQRGTSEGLLEISGGTINSASWVAIGRQSGTGTVNMSGGTWNKTGAPNFIIGNNDAGVGVMNMTGGTVVVAPSTEANRGLVWIGETGSATGTLNLSGSADFSSSAFSLAVGGSTTGTLNLNGGTIRTGRIFGGAGNASVTFNGTQIIATANQAAFISDLDLADITGGLLLDSNGFNLTAPQALGGTGGIVKSGLGSLVLSGANSFAGALTVNAGSVSITTASTGTGAVTLANDTRFGVAQTLADEVYNTSALTFGASGNSLDLNFGEIPGNTANAPLNVTGVTTLNGPVTVNIADTYPVVGLIPLVSYVGPKAGGGGFVLGTLPNGVVGTLSDNGTGLVSLNVTRANIPYWNGMQANSIWTTPNNWINDITDTETTYADPDPVLFDDRAFGSADVVLNSTVNPGGSGVTFNNAFIPYTLTGTGKISGTTGLLKQAAGTLLIGTANDYTGVTTLAGGVTSVNLLSGAAGAATSLGAATADPAKLVLAGGTLSYTGPTATSIRGFTIAATGSTISTDNNLTLTGPVVATGGNFQKAGAGNLTLSNPGANVFGTVNQGLRVHAGVLTLTGFGTQTNTVPGEMWVSDTPDVPADLVLNQTSLTVADFIAVGRGNGTTDVLSNFTATDSIIQSGNFSAGYANGIAGNLSRQAVVLNNTTWTNNGQTILGESTGGTTTMTLNGTSAYSSGATVHVGRDGSATLSLNGTSTFTGAGFITLGRYNGSTGVANVTGGTLTQGGTGNLLIVGEDGVGTLNVSGTGVVSVAGNSLALSPNATAVATVNLNTGGTIIARQVTDGAGSSTFNFDGGTLIAATGASLAYMAADTGTIAAGGANIDSNGNNIAISSGFSGAGGLTKTGAGTLFLDGSNTYLGTTTVSNGTLGGSGSIAGPVVVSSGAAIAPGSLVGVLTAAQNVTLNAGATLAVEIDDSQTPDNDLLAVGGVLNISGAVLEVNVTGGAAAFPYTIATAGSIVGDFASVSPGVTYTKTATTITITAAGTPFQSWINGFASIPAGERGPMDDPDGDGQSNLAEFALDGNPASGAASGKVVGKVASVGGVQTLVLTLPVRTVATFSGATEQVANVSGITYKIQGSDQLATWDLVVTEVPAGADKTAIEADMPELTPGGAWSYRTFSSPGPVSVDPSDFLRAVIVNP